MHRLPELELCGRDGTVMSALVQGVTATVSAAADAIETYLQRVSIQAGRLLENTEACFHSCAMATSIEDRRNASQARSSDHGSQPASQPAKRHLAPGTENTTEKAVEGFA